MDSKIEQLIIAAKSARKVLRAAARVNRKYENVATNRAIQAQHELNKLNEALKEFGE